MSPSLRLPAYGLPASFEPPSWQRRLVKVMFEEPAESLWLRKKAQWPIFESSSVDRTEKIYQEDKEWQLILRQ